MSIQNNHRNLIIRFVIFIALFIIVSGITGPWIIKTRLLYVFNFFIYGNGGKMVIFSSIVFFLLTREKIFQLQTGKYDRRNLLFIAASFLLIPLFFPLARTLLAESSFASNLPLTLTLHGVLITSAALLIPGVFGIKFLRDFFTLFKKEITVCLIISAVYDLMIFRVWKLWPYFSNLVLYSEKFLFSLTFANVSLTPPLTLTVEKFTVRIAEACSGLDSLFIFSSLYLIIGILDWRKMDKMKLILLFFPVAAGLVLVNILRVYLLILIGVVISPDLALSLFHTYAGMVLFIIYFLIFLKISYKRMLRNKL